MTIGPQPPHMPVRNILIIAVAVGVLWAAIAAALWHTLHP